MTRPAQTDPDQERGFASASISALLNPRSIAIVGISGQKVTTFKPGARAVLEHLRKFNYQGEIYPVNPKYQEIDGLRAYPDLAALPETPDCVVIGLPARAVPQVVRQCGEFHIKSALLLSSGFGELGPEGLRLERETRDAAHAAGCRLVGPNSTGTINAIRSICMSMASVLSAGGPIRRGRIALIVQSGALGSCLLDRARTAGAGISYMVSLGNQLDLDAADFFDFFAGDPDTAAVCAYLEEVQSGRRLFQAANKLKAAGKRLFVLLGSRSALGERAAASHTGRLTGRAHLERTLIEDAGATVVEDPDELWQSARFCSRWGPAPPTAQIGIFSISGGLAVLAADQLGLAGGFGLPEPGPEVAAALRESLPEYLRPANPLDLGPGTMPHGFSPALLAFARDSRYDVIAVVLPVVATAWQPTVTQNLVDAAQTIGKPLVVCWHAGDSVADSVRALREHGMPVFENPVAMVRFLQAVRFEKPGVGTTADAEASAECHAGLAVAEPEAIALLQQAGLSVPDTQAFDAPAAVLAAADSFQWPVVLKGILPGVAHKSELGLVKAGLGSLQELQQALRDLEEKTSAQSGPMRYLVQAQVRGDLELVLTIHRDADLGDFVSIGLGGIYVELLNDLVTTRLPVTAERLEQVLGGLRAYRLLNGYRGKPAINREWLVRTIRGLAGVATQLDLAELEVNPAVLSASGGFIVDVLMVRRNP